MGGRDGGEHDGGGHDGFAAELLGQLQQVRDAVLWKLDGLSEYDLRRPITPTGTNLLGLVKHLTGCEFGYFGQVFGRPAPVDLPWLRDAAAGVENADMWARPDESRDHLVGLYRAAWRHADETVALHDLGDVVRIPGWPEENVTLHRVLVHMIAETARHAGHADIVRELVDGAAGWSPGHSLLPEQDEAGRRAYVARVQAAAEATRRPRSAPPVPPVPGGWPEACTTPGL